MFQSVPKLISFGRKVMDRKVGEFHALSMTVWPYLIRHLVHIGPIGGAETLFNGEQHLHVNSASF